MTHANGEEPYYRFAVRKWEKLDNTIEPKEHGFPCDYTNLFLLQHSEFVPELLIESEEKYRFYTELKRTVNYAAINKDAANIGFEYGDVQYAMRQYYSEEAEKKYGALGIELVLIDQPEE